MTAQEEMGVIGAPVGPLGIIALEGCREMGDKVNSYLTRWHNNPEDTDVPVYTIPGYNREDFLINSRCPRFTNGEGKAIIHETVRGYDLYIMSDIGNYGVTYNMYGREVPMSPDDHFQDLKRTIAAVGGKARRITVIMPMLYESRQHRRQSRESLDCALALQDLTRMGVDNIITFDAHDPRVQNAIPLSGFESVFPTYQILKALLRNMPDLKIDKNNMMLVSPDEGGMGRNIYYATMMGLNIGMFYKRRDYSVVVNGRNPIVAHEYLGDDVAGKDILIVDDMLATGDSMLDIARELKKRNARRIFVAVTFGMFTQGLERFDEAYEKGMIDRVLATNLTYRNPELKSRNWFVEVDMSKYIAYIIATLNHDRSISKLLNPADRIRSLLERHRNGELV
nr:ribose-phosphate pyrophosphokinase [bacterium]